MTPTDLDELLACPRCDAPLASTADGHRCAACKVDFPRLDGLPFLFAEPEAALGEWQARLHLELRRLEARAASLDDELQSTELQVLTRQRMEQLRAACLDQASRLRSLLAPLLQTSPAARETYLALRTRLPIDQGLNTYYQNIHRDWGWGETENLASCELVSSMLPAQPGKMLVLGAGAGRLAYDLHTTTSPELTVGLDFNPLLLATARRVSAGEPVDLWEFPIAPRHLADQAVLNRLSAQPAPQGLQFVLADALRAPFRPGCFDTVVTPWLLDILPADLTEVTSRINRLLRPGGCWVNFGSLAFAAVKSAQCYSLEETLALVEAAGFGKPVYREDEIPYMCSPASRHGRRECVVTFSAEKRQDVVQPARHQALPDWLVTGQQAVPALREFQLQAASTRIFAFVMGMIDGKRSIRDMAMLMEQQRLMSRQEAEPTIRQFLIRMYDDSRREGSS